MGRRMSPFTAVVTGATKEQDDPVRATSITLLRGIHENVIEFSPATVAEADPP